MKKKIYKIFIFGSAGQIGSDLVKFFSDDHLVYAFQRNQDRKKNYNKNIKYIYHDFTKSLKIKVKPDVVINCIVTHEFSKKNNLQNYLESNIISMANLIEFANKRKAKKIINFSTISIYGKINVNLLHEKYIPIDQNLLAITKHVSESLLYNQPINFINLRLPGVLCSSKNYTRPWLKKIINKIKNNKKIEVYNAENNFNSVIDVEEITKLVSKVINNNKTIRDTFNFSASGSVKLRLIINKIKKYYNSTSKIYFRKSEQKPYLISVRKIRKILNFRTISTTKIIDRNL